MITIYTIPQCPYCNELKDLLIKENMLFTEVNVDLPENETLYQTLNEITKSDQVPIVKIKNHLLVPNVSFHTIPDAVALTKKLLA